MRTSDCRKAMHPQILPFQQNWTWGVHKKFERFQKLGSFTLIPGRIFYFFFIYFFITFVM